MASGGSALVSVSHRLFVSQASSFRCGRPPTKLRAQPRAGRMWLFAGLALAAVIGGYAYVDPLFRGKVTELAQDVSQKTQAAVQDLSAPAATGTSGASGAPAVTTTSPATEPAKPAVPAKSATKPSTKPVRPTEQVALLQAPADAGAKTPEDQKQLLQQIRLAFAEREMATADELLTKAKAIKGDADFTAQVERLDLINQYLVQFWKAVDRGAKTLTSNDEVVIGEVRAAVVEYNDGTLVLRVEGTNRRYTVKTIKSKLSVTLALRSLKDSDPAAKVVIGAFWAMDNLGDRLVAKRLWDEAGKAGQDVKLLMPELALAGVKPIEIPKLPASARAVLSPAQWQIRRLQGDRIARNDLTAKMASQNAEGQLQTTFEDAGQLVFKRRPGTNFTCRVILTDVGEGQSFGLFSADNKEAGYFVSLPSGTVKVEFSRKGQEFTAKVNDNEADVESIAGSQPKMAGQVGLTVPAGGTGNVAAFDLK